MPANPESQTVLAQLQQWCDDGVLRHLDHRFACFLHQLAPSTPASLLLASALLVHCEGRGHTCLTLTDLCQRPEQLLDWAGSDAKATLLHLLPTDPQQLITQWQGCPLLRWGPDAADQGQPLVIWMAADQARLYLRRYWGYEAAIAAHLSRRAAAEPLPQSAMQSARATLDQLFPPAVDATEPDWQKLACALALRAGITVITGGPGTGKTYTAARLIALLFSQAAAPNALRIALAAPTGKAAARLKQSIHSAVTQLASQLPTKGPELDLSGLVQRMGAALTLHALLGARPDTRSLKYGPDHPLPLDVLIVDEASMIHAEMMRNLLRALPASARLILLGDKDQLASVEAGSVLGDLCAGADTAEFSAETTRYLQKCTGQKLPQPTAPASAQPRHGLAQQTLMLRKSRRFQGPIGALAKAINAGDEAALHAAAQNPIDVQLQHPQHADAITRLALEGRPHAPGGYRPYLELVRAGPRSGQPYSDWVRATLNAFEQFRILCTLREGDWGAAGVNQAVQAALRKDGLLPKQSAEWYPGRPVMITRNEHALGVFNGDVGIALPTADKTALRVWLQDGETLRSVAVNRLAEIETAYAMTIHKSQGSEFHHCVVVLPPQANAITSRELLYTGVTRAKQRVTLVAPSASALQHALHTRTLRGSGLQQRLLAGLDTSTS
jgi:exodeoxyribonuclease V alpha subunit